MSIHTFQVLCWAVLAASYALAWQAARGRRRAFAIEAAAIALGSWLGEETCIRAYRFYAYADGWWPVLGHVPLLVVAIWPMVILSARAVLREVWPSMRGARAVGALAVAIVLDASLMEVIAVRKGLWAWAEPGYLDVPIVGILGWACFAGAIGVCLERGALTSVRGAVGSVVASVLCTHVALWGLWWGGLRWGLRGDLGHGAVLGFAPLAIVAAAAALRAPGRMATRTAFARVLAASVFFLLLVELRGGAGHLALLAHTALVALPYLASLWPRRPTRRL